MFADISAILDYIFDTLSSIGGLYISCGILSAVLALWIFRRLINFIRRLIP